MKGIYSIYCRMESLVVNVWDTHAEIYYKRPDGGWVRELITAVEFDDDVKPIMKDGKWVYAKKTIFGKIKILNTK